MNCPKCGSPVASSFSFCENCGSALEPQQPVTQAAAYEQPVYQQPMQPEKRENVVTGVIGALIGALIGAASIILLSQLGYVAAISGLILAVCTLKGYELLGRKMSTKGLIICIVIMLVTPYIADRIDWAIVAAKEMPYSVSEAFFKVPDWIDRGTIDSGDYYLNLAKIYGFVVLGGIGTVVGWKKK